MRLNGVSVLILTTVLLLVGQVETTGAPSKTLEPRGVSLANVSDTVNASIEAVEAMIPKQLDQGVAAQESRFSQKMRPISVDHQALQWAKLFKINMSHVFIELKF